MYRSSNLSRAPERGRWPGAVRYCPLAGVCGAALVRRSFLFWSRTGNCLPHPVEGLPFVARSLSIDEAQQHLPRGLELKQELLPHAQRTPGAFGQVFRVEDYRLGAATKASRAVRVICQDAEDAWWSKFLDRCRIVAEHKGSCIARPLEVEQPAPGVLFLTTDWFPTNLAAQLPTHGLKSPALVWSVVEQLAEGLADLHAGGSGPSVAHGDVCLENAFLDSTQLVQTSRISLADAAISQIPAWSNGERFVNRMRIAFPPEWQQKPKESSPQADVYALGVVALQLLLGTAAVEQALDSEPVARGGLWKATEASVRQKLGATWWRHRYWLSQALAVDLSQRFVNGRVARDALPKSIWRSMPARFAAAILVLTLFAVAIERFQAAAILTRELQNAVDVAKTSQKQVQQLRSETADLYRKNEQLKTFLETADQEIVRLRNPPVSSSPEQDALRDEKLAKETWRELTRRLGVQWGSLGKELDSLATERSLKPENLNQLKRWGKDVNSGLAFWQQWIDRARSEEKSFVESWTKFSNSPWDRAAREQAEKDRDALTIGSEIWGRYGNNEADSWTEFCRKVNAAADAIENKRVKTVINAWIAAFDQETKWTLRFHSAKAPKGYGTKRYISTFKSDGNRDSDWVEWSSEEGFDPPGQKSDRTRELHWKVGEPFCVWVEGESSKLLLGKLPDLLDATLRGPVVLWTLRKRYTIGKAPYQLELEVEKCPGPP